MLSFFKKKYVFYHIPKAGGTTLTAFIDQRFNLSEICPRTFFTPSAILSKGLTPEQSRQIQKYLFIRDHFFFNIANSLHGRVKKLTMLRDPARRAISQFYYYRSYTDEALDSDVKNGRMSVDRAAGMRMLRLLSLEEFLRNIPPQFEPEFNNTQTSMLAHTSSCPSTPPNAEKRLAAAAKNLKKFSYVGILELFEPSMQLLCFTFKWFYPAAIQPLNQLEYPERPELLSDHARLLLRPLVEYDEKVYALAKQDFLKRYQAMIASLLKKDKKFKDAEIKEAVHDPFLPQHQQ